MININITCSPSKILNLPINFLDEKSKANFAIIDLKNVNTKLWDIEDKIRIKESTKTFNSDFIELARSIYFTNDIRADIKSQINISFNSNICEVKDYVKYN